MLALAMAGLLVACADARYAPEAGTTSTGRGQLAAGGSELRFARSGRSLHLRWWREPSETEYGSLLLQSLMPDAAGEPALVDLPGELELSLWMPSMGHGSSPVTVSRLGPGTYLARDVFFTMPGEWELRIRLSRDGVPIDEATLTLQR